MAATEWAGGTIAAFGRSMGMDDLRTEDGAPLCLQFERSGTLVIEPDDDGVMIYVLRQVPPPRDGVARRALALCHHGNRLSFPTQAGFSGDETLLFASRIAMAEFSLPALERAFGELTDLHDRAAG